MWGVLKRGKSVRFAQRNARNFNCQEYSIGQPISYSFIYYFLSCCEVVRVWGLRWGSPWSGPYDRSRTRSVVAGPRTGGQRFGVTLSKLNELRR